VSASPIGRVYLIGAGPGDAGLITDRGLRLLALSDVVVYDRGVEALLRCAPADAERIEVGAPAERDTAQDAISILLAEKAREGHIVARLKWGDPFLFDSAAKEALFLHEQQVPFEVFLRGYEDQTDAPPDVDWLALAALDATIVCHASPRLAAAVLQELHAHVPADRMAAMIYRGTLASQETVTGTLAEVLAHAAAATRTDPAMLLVGELTHLREHLRWFDQRPLFGRRIVVTRSREQARELVETLENLGAQAVEAPTFRLTAADDPEAVERAAASVGSYDWVVFESANAVARFVATLLRGPVDLRAFGGVSICAIGPSTAERLVAHGLKPDSIIPEFRAEGVADTLASVKPIDGRRVLLVRPDHLRDVVATELTRGGAVVTDLIAYRTQPESPESPAVQDLYRMLLDGRIDAVTFTGPTAVRRFVALIGEEQAVDLLNTTTVAAIGPVTAAAAAELGITTTVMPDAYTVDGLVRALVAHFAQ